MASADVTAATRALGFARTVIVPIEPPRRHQVYTRWHAGDQTVLLRGVNSSIRSLRAPDARPGPLARPPC